VKILEALWVATFVALIGFFLYMLNGTTLHRSIMEIKRAFWG